MIQHQDFVPKQIGTEKFLFFEGAVYEDFPKAAEAASEWIEQNGIDVLNIETVVLPNMHREDGSTDPSLRSSGDVSTFWNQFVRVWYRHDESIPPPIPSAPS